MSANEWREPTTAIELRYGDYRPRHLVSLVLLFGGGALLQFGSVYTVLVLAGGAAATVAGWVVVPSPGWRRSVAVGPGFLGAVGLLNGAQSGALVALALAAWLFVRIRPLRSYVVLALPVAAAYLIALVFPQYPGRIVVATVLIAAVAASAWLARSLAALDTRRFRETFQRGHRKLPLK